MELFLHPASPNCVAVLMTADILGIKLTQRVVDLFGGAQHDANYLALNPNATVPVLRDNDFVLWETQVILQYLGSTVGDTPLWPADIRARADIARWQLWGVAHWIPSFQPYIFENLFKQYKGGGPPDSAVLAQAANKFERYGGILNKHLQDRDYLTGRSLTLADIANASYLMYAQPAAVPLAPYSNIQRWFERVASSPFWRRALPSSEAPTSPATAAAPNTFGINN